MDKNSYKLETKNMSPEAIKELEKQLVFVPVTLKGKKIGYVADAKIVDGELIINVSILKGESHESQN